MPRKIDDFSTLIQLSDDQVDWFKRNDPHQRTDWRPFAREWIAETTTSAEDAEESSNGRESEEEKPRWREGLSPDALRCKQILRGQGLILVGPSTWGTSRIADFGDCTISGADVTDRRIVFFLFERRNDEGKPIWRGHLPVLPKYKAPLNELLEEKRKRRARKGRMGLR